MGIDLDCAADLAVLLFQYSRYERTLNRKMRLVLRQVGEAPVRLPGLAFQRRGAWQL